MMLLPPIESNCRVESGITRAFWTATDRAMIASHQSTQPFSARVRWWSLRFGSAHLRFDLTRTWYRSRRSHLIFVSPLNISSIRSRSSYNKKQISKKHTQKLQWNQSFSISAQLILNIWFRPASKRFSSIVYSSCIIKRS